MTRFGKYAAIALLALVTVTPVASAHGMFFGRGYGVGFFYGPGFYGPGWWGWGGPWYGPAYVPGPPIGQVEIVTKNKGDLVYIDGGFAGRTGELKKFPLKAGTHTIELRKPGGKAFYQERINVIPGKKLKIHTDYPD